MARKKEIKIEKEVEKMDTVKVVLAVVLAIAIIFIATTQVIAWKESVQQEFYILGVNDAVQARNMEIFNDLQQKGFTVMEITDGNQSQQIILVPQVQEA